MKTLRKTLALSLTAVASLVLTAAAVVSAQPRVDDLRWALGTGQDAAEPLGYLPLSKAVVKASPAELDGASS